MMSTTWSRFVGSATRGTMGGNFNTLEGETMSRKEEIEKFRTFGYVTRDEAAIITGRQPGGNITALFEKYDVRHIQFSGKQDCRMYLKSDLKKVPEPDQTKRSTSIRGIDTNSIIDMIADLENRIKRIETELSGAT